MPSSNDDGSNLDVPKLSKGDAGHSLAKVAIGSVPVVGAAASELFAFIVSSPIERRRSEWMQQVGERLKAAEESQGVSLDEIKDNEEFIDSVLQATTIALRTSQSEKREALLNAITNTAISPPVESSNRQMFLRLVDDFTAWHLRLLKLFADPPQYFLEIQRDPPQNIMMGSLDLVLHTAHPELKNEREFYDQVWRDLHSAGLVTTDSLHGGMSGHGMMQQRTTHRGNDFLRFISKPE